MHMFGLTGGIGSGKSTVGGRFRARGLPILDADALAREVVEKGSSGLAAIVDAFGAEVLQPNGELNRKAVADIVFKREGARETLNGITHPRIGMLSQERSAALEEAGEPLVCYEAALLVETGSASGLRPLVVVTLPEAMQIERASKRDGATVDEISARVKAQLPMAEKAKVADFVIDNSVAMSVTLARADAVLDAICKKMDVDPARYPMPQGVSLRS
ncbi:MAG: dephospho-CoA kinase [Polyangiaceae bacterium]|nr:dephospho-CoA kinase [Polyangiaceae bacterium]